MKPNDWDEMTEKEKDIYARHLISSPRGLYLIAQALYIAIDKMKEVQPPYREVSDIEDMEIMSRFTNVFLSMMPPR